jgi:hypothetical protein
LEEWAKVFKPTMFNVYNIFKLNKFFLSKGDLKLPIPGRADTASSSNFVFLPALVIKLSLFLLFFIDFTQLLSYSPPPFLPSHL